MSAKVRYTIRGNGPYELWKGEGGGPASLVAHVVAAKFSPWPANELVAVIHREAQQVGYENIEFVYETDLQAPPDLESLLEDLKARILAASAKP